jgi:hypothetical protein
VGMGGAAGGIWARARWALTMPRVRARAAKDRPRANLFAVVNGAGDKIAISTRNLRLCCENAL